MFGGRSHKFGQNMVREVHVALVPDPYRMCRSLTRNFGGLSPSLSDRGSSSVQRLGIVTWGS